MSGVGIFHPHILIRLTRRESGIRAGYVLTPLYPTHGLMLLKGQNSSNSGMIPTDAQFLACDGDAA